MPSPAGANIANAAGRPASNGTPWSSAVIQPAIGEYVQDTLAPTADTNYVGVNVLGKWKTNFLAAGTATPNATAAPQPDWTAPVTDNAATGGLAQFVKAAGTIAEGGRCNIVAGVATANAAGTNVCYATGGVVADDFFWAPVFA